jgi:hypothetical protein
MKVDRFEFENSITSLLGTVSALELIAENATDDTKIMVDGAAKILFLKQEKIFDFFKQTFNLDEYNNEHLSKNIG